MSDWDHARMRTRIDQLERHRRLLAALVGLAITALILIGTVSYNSTIFQPRLPPPPGPTPPPPAEPILVSWNMNNSLYLKDFMNPKTQAIGTIFNNQDSTNPIEVERDPMQCGPSPPGCSFESNALYPIGMPIAIQVQVKLNGTFIYSTIQSVLVFAATANMSPCAGKVIQILNTGYTGITITRAVPEICVEWQVPQ